MATPATPTDETTPAAPLPHEALLLRCSNLVDTINDFLDISGIIDKYSVIPIQTKMAELKSSEKELRSALKAASPPLSKDDKKEYLKTLRDMRDYRRGLKDGVVDLVLGRKRKRCLRLAVVRYAGQCKNLIGLF